MKSILENRPLLAALVAQTAEVAGYLWQKGWAERNGGNITINITSEIDSTAAALPAISEAFPIGRTLPHLRGCYFYCKGTNKRMRDLARSPMENGAVVRITADCSGYEIVADKCVKPTSEIVSHLSIHNYLVGKGSNYKAVVHTHPTDLVAMSHNPDFLKKDALTNLLWSMIPETRAFCPRGVGVVPYAMPSSAALADATINELSDYDVVLWEKHGVCAVSDSVLEAFDMIDTLSKSAQIYIAACAMGFTPTGLSAAQMEEMRAAFNLPK